MPHSRSPGLGLGVELRDIHCLSVIIFPCTAFLLLFLLWLRLGGLLVGRWHHSQNPGMDRAFSDDAWKTRDYLGLD